MRWNLELRFKLWHSITRVWLLDSFLTYPFISNHTMPIVDAWGSGEMFSGAPLCSIYPVVLSYHVRDTMGSSGLVGGPGPLHSRDVTGTLLFAFGNAFCTVVLIAISYLFLCFPIWKWAYNYLSLPFVYLFHRFLFLKLASYGLFWLLICWIIWKLTKR